ncbi:uncharacterized protein LOC132286437 [Cornus florida]|uniref:uncharacterized protein LOC132286437 n=1 Tax=Cornus florida TaxID=4283 RepID=UPI00289ED124|nr:uncharacterized protein LOC132286437 [Cornus florida]
MITLGLHRFLALQAMAFHTKSSILAMLIIFAVVLSPMLPSIEARVTQQELIGKGRVYCPACVCCEPPPPGSCCRCGCASPVQTQSETGSP